MADFSIQDVAFTGFRVVRENRGAVAIWAAAALIGSLLFTFLVVGLGGSALLQLQALSLHPSPDPALALALLGRLAPMYALMFPAVLVFNALLVAAMNRVVLRPADRRFAYFAFGADELRQAGLQLLFFAVFLGVYLAAVVAIVVVAALAAVVAKGALPFIVFLCVVAALSTFVWLATRLSLAAPLTFDTGRINLFGSFALTRKRFWPIFGAYALTLALVAVVMLLCWLVILAVTAIAAGGDPVAGMRGSSMTSIGAYFNAPRLVQLALGAIVSALAWPLALTPPAAIYARLKASTGAVAPRVFT